MNNFYKIMFFNSVIVSTLITISSHSWLMMWFGMELNLISVIPMFSDLSNYYPNESSMKYFIVQSLASTIFLFTIMMTEKINCYLFNMILYLDIMLNSALLMKLGMAPFHSWLPEVMEGLSWLNCLLLLTWQKIAPMAIIMMIMKPSLYLYLSIITSSILSGILGLNQLSLRKIMAYSSINHMSWMIVSILSFSKVWSIYFIVYSMTNFFLIMFFHSNKLFYFNQLSLTMFNKTYKMIMMMNFLSLSGLPPLIGFLPKWLTAMIMVKMNNNLILVILMISTLLSIFMYMRIMFSTLMMSHKTLMLKSMMTNKFSIMMVNLYFLLMLMLLSLWH